MLITMLVKGVAKDFKGFFFYNDNLEKKSTLKILQFEILTTKLPRSRKMQTN